MAKKITIGSIFQDNRGSTAVDFALVMPMLIVATLMVFDVGRAMLAYSSINDVAADTARYASIHGPTSGGGVSDDEIIGYAQGQIAGLDLSVVDARITWSANKARGSTVTIVITSPIDFFVTRMLPTNPLTLQSTATFTVL